MPSPDSQIDSSHDTFNGLINLGATAHAAGDSVSALTAFESALALKPQDIQAVSACAALLFELSRPNAAFGLLKSIQNQLLESAEGCANLGVAAVACGQTQSAASYFALTLKLNPAHVAALTHLGLLAAREQRWLDAVSYARQCVAYMPNDSTAHTNLIDYLLGAHRATEAIEHWQQLSAALKAHPQIAVRHIVALALNAEFDAANQAMTKLNSQVLNELANFLQRGGAEDLPGLFLRQAHDAMQECDWRDYPRSCKVIGQEALHHGLQATSARSTHDNARVPPPFSALQRAAKSSDCIRVGFAATSLSDVSATQALAAELSMYDSSRFKFHIYSPTPSPRAVQSSVLAAHQVVEIAHFTDKEAVWRIRLDRLDLWFDLTLNTPWHRPYIAECRVAPLHVLPLPVTRQLPGGLYDYALSDRYLEGASKFGPNHIALALVAHACWYAGNATASISAPATRAAAGLSENAFVVCVFGPSAHITPKTFALWMRLLKLLPSAVLWLSPCSFNAQANLRREATRTDVTADRLIFAPANADLQVLLPFADVYLDTGDHSDVPTLVQALQMGVPVIAAGGLAGSVLTAARLEKCIFGTSEACLSAALHLAKSPAALEALRESVQSSIVQSPLFDPTSRASERARAWAMMVERSRAGLAPASFDVPLAGRSVQPAH